MFHLKANDESKIIAEKHNMTEPIQFLQAKVYGNDFNAVYGGCDSKSIGYFRVQDQMTYFGALPVDPDKG